MATLHPSPDKSAHILPVARKFSDRAVFIWGVAWTVIVVPILVLLWVVGGPLQDPLFTVMVFIGLIISTFLTGLVSRADTTLILTVAPAMLFILLEGTNTATALALWGTAYFVGMLMRLRNLSDTAETSAYILGSAFACAAAMQWFQALYDHPALSAFIVVAVYLLTRLVISSIRLAVVTSLSWQDAFRALLPHRIALFTIGIVAVAIAGHSVQHAVADRVPTIGLYGGGAIAIFLIGVATFAIGISSESRLLSTQLKGTLKAALDLPWTEDKAIEEHAIHFTERILPQYDIELRPQAERNFNEIVSPMTDGYLVARRGSTQSPFLTQDQRVLDAVAHIADTMAAARSEREKLAMAASTDELTGLPNYRGFHEALARLADTTEGNLAVAYVDIDGFKEINDSYGHEAGNTVLRSLAARMRNWLPASDFVARVGGDEFVLILTGLADEAEGHRRLIALSEEASAPLSVDGSVISLSISHGIAFADSAETDMSILVAAADTQMYAGRGRRVVESTLAAEAKNTEFAETVSRAIQEHRLTFAYQPVVDYAQDRIVALEALVRPNEDALRGIPAETIVDEARHLGLLTKLSTHMIDTTVADMQRFQEIVPELASLHVNIDVEQVTDPVFLATMRRTVTSSSVDITLELSETSLDRASDNTNNELERLRDELGVRVALDDFGRSSSTLLAIVEYPLDVLKIDRSMIRSMNTRKPQLVMTSMAQLTSALDVMMVVEGVEDEETCKQLAIAGTRYMQGYRFGSPLTADQLADRLSRHGLRGHLPRP